jgi:hypothetical protein
MYLLTWRFITIILVALGLTMGAAHLLELPSKMQYDAEMYAAVTSTLYRLFGSVGAFIQLVSILAAAILTFLVRSRPAFRLTLFATLCLIFSLILWFILVAPVNAEWLQVIESTPELVPQAYVQLRDRWEYGHVAAFIAWFCGFCLLVLSVLIETS